MSNLLSWCAYNVLPPITLTQSGLVHHLEDEVETVLAPNVQLRISTPLPIHGAHDVTLNETLFLGCNEDRNQNYIDRSGEDLVLIITTHRIVLLCNDTSTDVINNAYNEAICFKKKGRAIHLRDIQRVEPAASSAVSSLFRRPKIRLYSLEFGELVFVFQEHKMRDKILKELEQSLKRKAWERREEMGKNKKVPPSGVGVAAIISRNRQKNAEARALSRTAFKEYEGLLQKAKDVQAVIERYSATLDKNKQKDNGDKSDPETIKLTEMLRSMGMTNNALTKRSASLNIYNEQLARQLAEFLIRGKFINNTGGGMMTLVDVYCLFNRALGTNLISPDDLLSAASLMHSLDLGFCMASKIVELNVCEVKYSCLTCSLLTEEISKWCHCYSV